MVMGFSASIDSKVLILTSLLSLYIANYTKIFRDMVQIVGFLNAFNLVLDGFWLVRNWIYSTRFNQQNLGPKKHHTDKFRENRSVTF